MGGNAQYKAQANDAGLKDTDEAEQQPETPTPLDKTAGEDTERRAPDLTGFWVQAPITEPELMGMTSTEDLSMPDCGVIPVARRKARRHQSDLRVVTTSKDSHRQVWCTRKPRLRIGQYSGESWESWCRNQLAQQMISCFYVTFSSTELTV